MCSLSMELKSLIRTETMLEITPMCSQITRRSKQILMVMAMVTMNMAKTVTNSLAIPLSGPIQMVMVMEIIKKREPQNQMLVSINLAVRRWIVWAVKIRTEMGGRTQAMVRRLTPQETLMHSSWRRANRMILMVMVMVTISMDSVAMPVAF